MAAIFFPANKPKVLLIDDIETYRKLARNAMEIEGFEFLEAGNGREALTILKDIIPDIILADIRMPEMDGITFLKEIKKDQRLDKIPVIMITNIQEELDKAVLAGAEEAVLKSSITPKQMVEICKKYLNKE